ncbi:hypothetical protein ABZ027_02665 [Streptomyces sp. NPDC006332]|uniref:hypothetical protein n=1 Tax=Streptomyces sp. NPDC006332 TaxID=3155456 RepID=UPI0033AB7CDA
MDSDAHACPVCGQPVDTVVRRHKTLGAWVPVWVAGPCRNPECAAYVAEGTEFADSAEAGRKSGRAEPGAGDPRNTGAHRAEKST